MSYNITEKNTKIRLLFLSGGSLVGQNILSSLSMRREGLNLMVMNSKADEPAIFEYDTACYCPSLVEAKKEFETVFYEVLADFNPDLIIPCRDEDVAFVSELAELKPHLKSKLLCGDHNVAVSMLDKGLSWEFSKKNKLPFAPTIYSNSDQSDIDNFINEHQYPIIAKPRRGFASRGVKLLVEPNQLKPLIGRDDYIFQKYLGNPEKVSSYVDSVKKEGVPLFHTFEEVKISIQGCIGPNGNIGGIFVTEHIMKYGKSEGVNKSNDQELYKIGKDWIEKIASAGWAGPINIQCQRDQSGKLFIYEFNGRFTGATSGRVCLGFDEVGITLGLWLEKEFPESGISNTNESVLRAPVSKLIDLEKVNQILTKGIWNA